MIPTAAWAGQSSSAARLPLVKASRPRAAAAIGGAIAAGYQRCAGHTSHGSCPLAAASNSASVGRPSWAKDWAGLRAATGTPRWRRPCSKPQVTQVLPTSVAVPQTTASRSGRDNRGQAGQELADLLVTVSG